MGKRGVPIGHRQFTLKLYGQAETTQVFGAPVWVHEDGYSITLHTAMSSKFRCNACGGQIGKGMYYMRLHAVRHPDWNNQPVTQRICCHCVDAKRLPEKIVKLEIITKE